MNIKRIIVTAAAVLLMTFAFGTAAFAVETTVVCDTVTAKPGDTVTVNISLKDNTGIAGMVLTPSYDSTVLTLTSVKKGSLTSFAVSYSKNITLDTDGENVSGDGSIAVMTFAVSENASAGSYPVTVKVRECVDENYDDVALTPVAGAVVVEGGEKATLETAQVTVGSDLTLDVTAVIDESVTSPRARFTGIGSETVIEGTKAGSEWTFEFPGICSQYMADKIKIEILDGEEVLCTRDDYSIREYFNELYCSSAEALGLTSEKFAALKHLLADTLEYGAAAQRYVGYNTGDLANSLSWVASEKSTFTAPGTDYKVLKAENPEDKIVAMNLIIGNDIRFKAKVKMTNAARLVISNGVQEKSYEIADMTKDGEYFTVIGDGLMATSFGTVFTFTLTDGAAVYQQITYSVNSYVAAKYQSEKTELADMVKAIYNYGISAENY